MTSNKVTSQKKDSQSVETFSTMIRCVVCLLVSVQLTSPLELDLSGSDWTVESDLRNLDPQELSEVLRALNPHHRAEVKLTKQIKVNGTVTFFKYQYFEHH
jgi:hypothetical protein